MFPFPFESPLCVQQDSLHIYGGTKVAFRTKMSWQFSTVLSKVSPSWTLIPQNAQRPCPPFSLTQALQLLFLRLNGNPEGTGSSPQS